MKSISDILKVTSHRPWPLPPGEWTYYQEWNNAIFLHWQIDPDDIESLLPGSLQIDTIDGKAWISVVAFTMERIRPRNLPALTAISNFHEINVRTYVFKDNKPGVYFLNIEAQKTLSVLIAKSLSGLPYEKANISRTQDGNLFAYVSRNKLKNFNLDISYEIKDSADKKSYLDTWLTERYCLYADNKSTLFRYEIHHEEWNIKTIQVTKLNLRYQIGNLSIRERWPDIAHFSEGVKVLAWRREKL